MILRSNDVCSIHTNGEYVWLCVEISCSGSHCHTMPAIHKGKIRKIRVFYNPFRTKEKVMKWALKEMNRLADEEKEILNRKQKNIKEITNTFNALVENEEG